MIRRRRKPGDIGDQPTAYANDNVVTRETKLCELTTQIFDG